MTTATAPRLFNVPAPLTPIIGREQLAARCVELLRDGGSRLLTLLGPGGVGKTRLSLHLAHLFAAEFAGGAAFVPLEAVRAVEDVPGAVLQAVSLARRRGGLDGGPVADAAEAPVEALSHRLPGERHLLVLDNLEQVIGAAGFVDQLLTTAPALSILVTSRAPLQLPGEVEVLVPPLSLAPPAGGGSGRSPALELFLQRATAAASGLQATAANTALLEDVVARLDGLPLALELAAARLRGMSVAQLRDRMNDRLGLLSRGGRAGSGRHQALRATIAWSYDLLDEQRQRMFRRLGVFVGGFTFEHVALLAAEAGMFDDDPLDGLLTLIEHSLVVKDEEPDGRVRYRMLETIREFAMERSEEAGEEQAARDRHATVFLQMAADLYQHVAGPRGVALIEAATTELPNLRAALARLLEIGDGEGAVRMAGSLYRLWMIRGLHQEGMRWAAEALSIEPVRRDEWRARTLNSIGNVAWSIGDIDRAEVMQREALAIWEELGSTGPAVGSAVEWNRAHAYGMGDTLHNLGVVAQRRGQLDEAESLLTQALSWKRRLDGSGPQIWTLLNLGVVEQDRGRIDAAVPFFLEAVALCRSTGDRYPLGNASYMLASAYLKQGAVREALPLFVEAVDVALELGYQQGVQFALGRLTLAVAALGAERQAAVLWGAVNALAPGVAAEFVTEREGIAATQLPGLLASVAAEPARSWYQAGVALDRDGALRFARAVAAALVAGHPPPLPEPLQSGGIDLPSGAAPPGDGGAKEAVSTGQTGNPSESGRATRPVMEASALVEQLTERELAVLRRIAEGRSTREIATELFISIATVERHITNLYGKLGIRGRAEATAYALRNNLV